jgi:hypothetical protein
MPLARLVTEWEVIADATAATARVHEPSFDPARSAVLAKEPSCSPAGQDAPIGQATILERRPGSWRILTESGSPALLVVSESAYPGWQVTIDGETAESLLAYTTIRGVCVPAGSHTIEWRFRPIIFVAGGGVTLAALLVIALAASSLWSRPGEERR